VIRSRSLRLPAAAVLALLLAAHAHAQQTPRFHSSRLYPIGGVPADMALVDLNGDSRLDVVATNFNQGTISVLLGTANGFEPLADMPAATSPTQIATGLFDEDTFLDLVISETEADTVTFMHGNGDGTFADPELRRSGHDSQGLAAAHMNGDDNLDLVVSLAAEGGGHVDIMLGNGDGTFVYDEDGGRNLSAGSFGVGVVDLNGDGPLDVVATTFDDKAFVLLGDGAGGLGRADPFPTGAGPFGIATADFTGDSRPDVITADGEAGTVSLLRNDGEGGLAAPVAFQAGFGPVKVVAADVNGDGDPDVLTANTGSGDVSVLHGDGDGGFGAARHFAAPPHAFAVRAADVNGDEAVDLLAVVEGALVVMLARPGGYEAIESVLPGPQVTDIEQADLNGDGLPDLVASSRRVGVGVVSLLAQASGGFAPPQTVTDNTDAGTLALADLNADQRPDVVALSRNNPDVLVLLAQSTGGFGASRAFEIAGPASSIAVADFDGDSRTDLAAASISPAAVSVLFGNGDGTFQPRVVVELAAAPAHLTVGEFDATPGPDLAASSLIRSEIALLLARPGRTFEQRTVATPAAVLALHSADFDGDGADDIAAAAARSTARVFYGDGTGGFTPGPNQSLGTVPIALGARDITGDGRPDLLFADQAGSMVGVARYAGDRVFDAAIRVPVGQSPVAIASADFNGDGAYDLVGAGNSTAILSNAGVGVRRGDGNGDTALSVADVSVVAGALAARPAARIEDVQRDTPGVSAGADVNGDGSVDASDLRGCVSRLFAGA
jgi:hypothetical protein